MTRKKKSPVNKPILAILCRVRVPSSALNLMNNKSPVILMVAGFFVDFTRVCGLLTTKFFVLRIETFVLKNSIFSNYMTRNMTRKRQLLRPPFPFSSPIFLLELNPSSWVIILS